MSFDSSIENIIKKFNEQDKIKNILHIGACLGEEVYFYRELNPDSVYWFEPNPKLLTQLRSNVEDKGFENIKKVETCEVDTINIDEFLKENNLKTNFDLVSLDTQGHDFEILNSSEIILNSKLIVIETAKVELYEGQVIDEEIEKFLINKGYRKEYYHEFHQVWGDTLFVKN